MWTGLAWDLRGWGVGWSGASSRGERGAAEAQGAEARREEEERKGETDADRWAPSVSDGRRGCEVMRVTRKRRERRAGALRGSSGPGERAHAGFGAPRAEREGEGRRVGPGEGEGVAGPACFGLGKRKVGHGPLRVGFVFGMGWVFKMG